ncbi:hypothetical protein [Staphylococcus pseudintermedius]|uniref:hypothetical protein n=1 Tax=Staphylococcus pseudintermedius TaxID=283734 RepID=UPI0019331D8A|nr:hypothetical protein [Staphylococcus pseudintermedius]EGQ4060138.1 hypothetical protein [Staphylococcus pseudintermedius]EJD8533334.1 hypothetical protein [Staphylococcus pseudintermedius]MBM0287825.1 hypothetical protein [Staphylococcus pseudintermedius]
MILKNNKNHKIKEIFNGLERGSAIDLDYKGNSFNFYKENEYLNVYVKADLIGEVTHDSDTLNFTLFGDRGDESTHKVSDMKQLNAICDYYGVGDDDEEE